MIVVSSSGQTFRSFPTHETALPNSATCCDRNERRYFSLIFPQMSLPPASKSPGSVRSIPHFIKLFSLSNSPIKRSPYGRSMAGRSSLIFRTAFSA